MNHTARPRYLTIADEVRGRIERGELVPGERVPSTRAIVRDWGVAMATATKVIATLRQEGLVESLPGVGTVVVGADASPARSARPTDKSQSIISEAVAIADREGLDAVTLRRVAVQANLSPGTLLRHFSERDDLVRRMTVSVVDAVTVPRTPVGDWRAGLAAVAHAVWSACTDHPWLAGQMSITRPEPARGGLQLTEQVLASLDGHGLSLADMINIHLMLINYVRGSALSLEAEVEAAASSGLTRRQWISRRSHRTRTLAAETQVPLFSKVHALDHEVDLEVIFELGLERLLDGIEVLLGQIREDRRRRAGARDSRSPDGSATVSGAGTARLPAEPGPAHDRPD